MNQKISIVGMGYVGCGNALMLAKNNSVSIVDIDQQKVDNFNKKQLPIFDEFAQQYLENEQLNISATSNLLESIENASYVILALPTNFNEITMEFDTQLIDRVVEKVIDVNKDGIIVIKSTVNIGYTKSLKSKFNTKKILFSPEFLREGHALDDNLNPSRIIIGGDPDVSKSFGQLITDSIPNHSPPMLLMECTEAESTKLFSNTYLAMRVSFFNELDSFCMDNTLSSEDIIRGVSLDNRIGNYYNNPSFGFGGYCLPKDSKQLLSRFKTTPHNLLQSIQDSNKARAIFLADKIMEKKPEVVGIYKLAMKQGSDNSREASIFSVIQELAKRNVVINIFDPSIQKLAIENATLIIDFKKFIEHSDLIVANRLDNEIKQFSDKVFSRDIFSSDE